MVFYAEARTIWRNRIGYMPKPLLFVLRMHQGMRIGQIVPNQSRKVNIKNRVRY